VSVDDGTDQSIKDVWLYNFFEAMDKISSLVDEYNYISMVSAFIFLTWAEGY